MTSSSLNVLIRVMHISRGLPLISAEQDPHFPALQFQRTARSPACVAWIWWIASGTTPPGTAALRFLILDDLLQFLRERWQRHAVHLHRAAGALARDNVEGPVLRPL